VRTASVYVQDPGQLSYPAAAEVAAVREESDPSVQELVSALRNLELDELSPRQAWTALERLKRMVEKGGGM